MNRIKRINAEVVASEGGAVVLSRAELSDLVRQLPETPRNRIRLCAHPSSEDRLHEMFIVHTPENYVRPHRHTDKDESISVLSGEADLVLFADDGSLTHVVALGSYESGKSCYVRLPREGYHGLVIRSDVFVFHEVTTGPFVRADTIFAPWSPEDVGGDTLTAFRAALDAKIFAWRALHS